MAKVTYNLGVDRIRKARKGYKPIRAKDFNALIQGLKVALASGSTGSMGSFFAPSGAYHRSVPQGSDTSQAFWAVIRDTGTGDDVFLQVNRVNIAFDRQNNIAYTLDRNAAVEKVFTVPGLLSKDYAQLVYLGSIIDRSTPVVEVRKINGNLFAMQTMKWMLAPRQANPLLRITECVPIEAQQ